MIHASLQSLSVLSLNGLADLSLSRMQDKFSHHFLRKELENHHLSLVYSKQTQFVCKDPAKISCKTLTECYLLHYTA